MKIKTTFIAFAIIAASLLLGSTNAFATTTVSSSADIAAAIASGETSFKLADDFVASAQIPVPANKNYTIDGDGHKITRSASYLGTIFNIPATSELTLKNITIDGGAPGWIAHIETYEARYNDDETRAYAMYPVETASTDIVTTSPIADNSGTMNLNNVTLQNTFVSGNASGINNNGSLNVESSTFRHNHTEAGLHAGAIYCASSSANLTINNSKFTGNNGGKDVVGSYNDGASVVVYDANSVSITNSEFSDNTTVANGAGIFLQVATTATISNSTFTGNKSGNDGAAVFLGAKRGAYERTSDLVRLENNIFKNNIGLTSTRDKGNAEGALVSYGYNFKKIVINGGSFVGNNTSFNSAIALYFIAAEGYPDRVTESVEVSNVVFDGNRNNNNTYGGAIAFIQSIDDVKVSNITYKNNCGRFSIRDAKTVNMDGFNGTDNTSNGTILYVFDAERATVKNIEFYDNEIKGTNPSNYYGGGLFAGIGSLQLSNVTAKRNNGGLGAGLTISNSVREQGNVVVENIDIEDNVSDTNGGGLYIKAAKPLYLTVEKSIITNNKSVRGGGVFVDAADLHNITIVNESKIYSNSATESADDVLYNIPSDVQNAQNLGQLRLPVASDMRIGGVDGWYHDAANARYSADNAVEQKEVILSSAQSYYLKAANSTGAEITGPINDSDAENPSTVDLIGIFMFVAATSAVAAGNQVRKSVVLRKK